MHYKNLKALLSYKNIQIYITRNINELNTMNLKEFDCVYSPSIPVDVSKYPNTKFIFGPHFSVFPELNHMNLIRQPNVTYIQPSDWASQLWANNPLCKNIKIKPLPFGVDADFFKNDKPINMREKVFIYFKSRNPLLLQIVEFYLKEKSINYVVFNYNTKYNETDYINYLKNSKYGIWIGRHESQGFALEEALSCDVPLLVLNVQSMNEEYKSGYEDIPGTTIPYWDNRCGEYFYNLSDMNNKFNLFISKLETYKPRDYILENLTIEKCEEKLIDIIRNF
jgi:hypothetical protein